VVPAGGYEWGMRLGVLDAGSNTVHLLIVDGTAGGPPLPVFATKQPVRLAERVDGAGTIDDDGVARLVACVRQAATEAARQGVDELYAFATAAVRDAPNGAEVLRRIEAETGVRLHLLSGEQEAVLTFTAVRRWLGWSAGPLLLLDIGGGSAEIAWGRAEEPSFAVSLPLGAGLLTRQWFTEGDPPRPGAVRSLRRHVRDQLGAVADRLRWEATQARAVATSRTFQQLARLCGAPPQRRGPFARRQLRLADLQAWLPRLAEMPAERRARLPGISRARANQSLAGAVVAERLMRTLGLDEVEICPWALREGMILHRFEAYTGARLGQAPVRPTQALAAGPRAELTATGGTPVRAGVAAR
jgi:exopolyphosphatase/guanosine-5'-triphosphate,3'-diphosphate pyrophosphatase